MPSHPGQTRVWVCPDTCLPRHGGPPATSKWYSHSLVLLHSPALTNRMKTWSSSWPSKLVTPFSSSSGVRTLPARDQVRGQVASLCPWLSLVFLTILPLKHNSDPAQVLGTQLWNGRKGKGRIWILGSGRRSPTQSFLRAHQPQVNAVPVLLLEEHIAGTEQATHRETKDWEMWVGLTPSCRSAL